MTFTPKAGNRVTVTCTIDPAIAERLDAVCASQGIKRPAIVAQMIGYALDQFKSDEVRADDDPDFDEVDVTEIRPATEPDEREIAAAG